MYVFATATAVLALLIGYALGRMHQRQELERLRGLKTVLVRPHTAQTVQDYPMPEEKEDKSTVVESDMARTNLPSSGVKWD